MNNKDKCINYAHRGASAYAPGNTMSSFLLGLEMKANGIELDLQETKDGRIVIFHDEILDKTSNCTGRIKDYTYKELLDYDFGSYFDSKYKNEKIVLFDDFAREFLGMDLTFAIELKFSGYADKVISIINKYKKHDNFYITSFKYEALEEVFEIDKSIKLSWLIPTKIDDQILEKAKRINLKQICLAADTVDEEQIMIAKENNLGVRIFAVKNQELMEKVYKLDIEGMTVNFPDKLYDLMNK